MLMVFAAVENHWSLDGKWKILLLTITFVDGLKFAVSAYGLKK